MKAIILYGSYYGSTKQYALALSERTGVPALPVQKAPELSGYDTVIHMGGLYAGKIMGLSKTAKLLRQDGRQTFILVTVGMGDPESPDTKERIQESLRSRLPPALAEKAELYCLRGAMDYQALTLRHKMMIRGFYLVTKKKEGDPEDRFAPADYVDLNSLVPLVNRLTA